MNNMKKALALVMSLALAASTFVVGAAYDDVPENHDNRIAINLLGDLGVMVGDAGTNDFRPEGTLKRSEAAAIVYRLRTGKTNADSYVGTTGFSDVSDSHWASGYINYCVNQGIIAGYPDGTFKPDQDVTYAEYIKMVVCALNLQKVTTTTYIDMNTGVLVSEDKITTEYPTGYIALASDQQINEGIDYLNPNDKITRAEVAQGAYNAIFESYYKLDAKDADYVKDGTTYQHLAEQVFKLNKTTGVVTAYEDYTVGNGSSQNSDYFEVDGDKTFEYADFDPALVGQEVYVWEKERNISSATDEKVVAVVATENNTVTTINANDLKKDGDDRYYTDVNGKKQTLKMSDVQKTQVMLNGQAYTGTTAQELLTDLAECRLPVDLTIIDSDDSPKSPTVIAVKVYAETEVTSVTDDKLYVKNVEDTYSYNDITVASDEKGALLYQKMVAALKTEDIYDTAEGSIDLLNDDDTVNNDVTYYDGIAKEDKVMMYADVNGVIDIREIEEKEGTIKAMSGSKFRVGEEDVYIVTTDAMKELMTNNNNNDAVAYIDPFTGYVINVDEGVGNVSDYYYVHLAQNQYASSDYQLTAYDYEGNKVTLTFKDATVQKDVFDKLGVDTTSFKNNFAVVDAIGIFNVNSKGEITAWRTNNTDALKTADYDKDAEYNTKTGYVNIGGDRVEIKPSSVVFGVTFEDDATKEKIDDVKTYVGSFPKTTDQTTSVDYYLKKDDDDLKAALVHGKTKGGNTEYTNVTGYVVDERFEYTGDDKGYAVYTIATKGEIKEYETEVVDDTDLRDGKGADSVKGMMIKFDLTTDGKILYSDSEDIEVVGVTGTSTTNDVKFEKVVADGTMSDFNKYYPGSAAVDEDEIYYGIVVESKTDKYLQLVSDQKTSDGKYASIIIDYADDVKVYRIDDKKWDKATVGTTGNITDSNDSYTTFVAVRISDGDDVNDARITEVYTKTLENKDVDGITYADVKDNIGIVAGDKDDDTSSSESDLDKVDAEAAKIEAMTAKIQDKDAAKDEDKTWTVDAPEGYKFTAAGETDVTGLTNKAKVTITEDKITITSKGCSTGIDSTTDGEGTVNFTLSSTKDSRIAASGTLNVVVTDDTASATERAEVEAAAKEFAETYANVVAEKSSATTLNLPAGYELAAAITSTGTVTDYFDAAGSAGDKSVQTKTGATQDEEEFTVTIRKTDGNNSITATAKIKVTIGNDKSDIQGEWATVSIDEISSSDGVGNEITVAANANTYATYTVSNITITTDLGGLLTVQNDKLYRASNEAGVAYISATLTCAELGETKTVDNIKVTLS